MHARRDRRHSSDARPGTALVAAIGILALSGAVLGVAFSSATAAARAARSEVAALQAETVARHVTAVWLARSAQRDHGLAVGAWAERALSEEEQGGAAADRVSGRIRLQRLESRLYALVVDIRVGHDATLARRRLRVLLERVPADSVADSTTAARAPLRPISRWSTADLY